MAFKMYVFPKHQQKLVSSKKQPNKLKANYEMLIASNFIGKATPKFNHRAMPKD